MICERDIDMRHRKRGRQLGRDTDHRRALFRNLVTSLLEHERIETTEAKAKEVRAIADRMISLGKRGDLHARRLALSYIQSKEVVAKLFSDIAPRFMDRNGGYVRIIKSRVRPGDRARLSVLELVELKKEEKTKGKERQRQKSVKEETTTPTQAAAVS